jgi:prepilin-type N-terminal cleavage/methylation domain-containing protein
MIRNERGLTLIECLVALAIITIGLTAIATGMQLATSGVTTGQQETTATFLAEQQIEDIKAFALSTAATQGFANVTAANFPAEGYGSIAGGYNKYRRTTTIASPSATTRLVTVNVFYIPVGISHSASSERQVTLSTLLRER